MYNHNMEKQYDTILNARNQGFRAGGLIVKDGKILLMHQILGDEDFYTLPGGTWEKGETIEETCAREIKEEFGIDVEVGNLVFLLDTKTRIAFYFICETDETEIQLGGPEKDRMNEQEQYHVEWLNLDEIAKVNFIPAPAKEGIIQYLTNPDQPTYFLTTRK
jgi:8-oxo-dGTP diphosphatase